MHLELQFFCWNLIAFLEEENNDMVTTFFPWFFFLEKLQPHHSFRLFGVFVNIRFSIGDLHYNSTNLLVTEWM